MIGALKVVWENRQHETLKLRIMPVRTKRWSDLPDAGDGFRLLICRYRPRGVSKADETWDAWEPDLGPSKTLLAGFHAKSSSPISWEVYRRRYLEEMRERQPLIAALAARVRAGETITLLCSSACERESRCHRSLLRELIEAVK
jgi:uncharacterized protein YeaO (DUF488 family)